MNIFNLFRRAANLPLPKKEPKYKPVRTWTTDPTDPPSDVWISNGNYQRKFLYEEPPSNTVWEFFPQNVDKDIIEEEIVYFNKCIDKIEFNEISNLNFPDPEFREFVKIHYSNILNNPYGYPLTLEFKSRAHAIEELAKKIFSDGNQKFLDLWIHIKGAPTAELSKPFHSRNQDIANQITWHLIRTHDFQQLDQLGPYLNLKNFPFFKAFRWGATQADIDILNFTQRHGIYFFFNEDIEHITQEPLGADVLELMVANLTPEFSARYNRRHWLDRWSDYEESFQEDYNRAIYPDGMTLGTQYAFQDILKLKEWLFLSWLINHKDTPFPDIAGYLHRMNLDFSKPVRERLMSSSKMKSESHYIKLALAQIEQALASYDFSKKLEAELSTKPPEAMRKSKI